MAKARQNWADYGIDLVVRVIIRFALTLPYRRRVPFMGWVMARVVAPVAGYDKRVRANLGHVRPDLSDAEVRRLMRRVPDNFGRSLIEIYSGQEFIDRVRGIAFSGPGVAALTAAHAMNRPVILVTGHFGNYDAPRAALFARGCRIGGLYNPMSNRFFNDHYVAAISALGTPVFERGRHGLAQMIRFLKSGGTIGMVADHFMAHGQPLDFMRKPAYTALSAAEMSIKYDALLVPIYGIRKSDGLSFEIRVEAPVAHGDPVAMTQALNDNLADLVRGHIDQWFWIHRRWKSPPPRD